jgi:pSer/pThr/pTyr-binding forkhead associated (FHA) protein
MLTPDDYQKKVSQQASLSASVSTGFVSQGFNQSIPGSAQQQPQGMPQLVLHNNSLNIRIVAINGAIIGRRQGPYTQCFQQNLYVSGVHAQLKYKAGTGWCIADKHSSNGTRLNNHLLQPDVEMSIKNGDIVTIANVNLQVSVS